MVTESTIKYLKNNAICFKVYGSPDNSHKPYYESENTIGEGSTLQNSEESKEISNESAENISQDFSIKDQSAQNISAEVVQEKSNDQRSAVKNYEEPQPVEMKPVEVQPVEQKETEPEAELQYQPKHREEANDKFDEMFIYGGQPNVENEPEEYQSRMYSQSVYEKPKGLISDHEKAEVLGSQPKDDHYVKDQNSSGKKKKKGKKGKKGKGDKKDCVIF